MSASPARHQLQAARGLCLLGALMVLAHALGPGWGFSLQSVTAMTPIGIFLFVAGSALFALTHRELRAARARRQREGQVQGEAPGRPRGSVGHLHLIRGLGLPGARLDT